VVREPVPRGGGNATPRLEFRGEFLHAFTNDKRVKSDQPVELRRGGDVFTGDTFDYDHQRGVANLQGRVRGVLQPRPAS
jgi:lipopolysaccharide export system protein LptC